MAQELGAERRCLACGEVISSAATLCKHCRTYQSRWRNWLVFGAQISGFLAFIAAAITFLITSAPAARKVLWWRDDLKVLGFKSNEYILVGNDGDGPVYVSHANLVMDLAPFGKRTVTQRLNTLVPQDTILSIGITPDVKGETKYVGSPSLEVWNIALQRTIRGDNNCFWPVVFAASDPSFLIVKEAYSSQSQALRTFPALATVGYYSLHTKQLREFNMPVVGAIAFRDMSECTKSP